MFFSQGNRTYIWAVTGEVYTVLRCREVGADDVLDGSPALPSALVAEHNNTLFVPSRHRGWISRDSREVGQESPTQKQEHRDITAILFPYYRIASSPVLTLLFCFAQILRLSSNDSAKPYVPQCLRQCLLESKSVWREDNPTASVVVAIAAQIAAAAASTTTIAAACSHATTCLDDKKPDPCYATHDTVTASNTPTMALE
ncbi:hypothetical protein BDZ45DRAFT_737269 [Acephala macrosclerotiorum]|nr:hypothetical protein BDZ45DRAFT_737269 [Acephala macrosclerotiorum]